MTSISNGSKVAHIFSDPGGMTKNGNFENDKAVMVDVKLRLGMWLRGREDVGRRRYCWKGNGKVYVDTQCVLMG